MRANPHTARVDPVREECERSLRVVSRLRVQPAPSPPGAGAGQGRLRVNPCQRRARRVQPPPSLVAPSAQPTAPSTRRHSTGHWPRLEGSTSVSGLRFWSDPGLRVQPFTRALAAPEWADPAVLCSPPLRILQVANTAGVTLESDIGTLAR